MNTPTTIALASAYGIDADVDALLVSTLGATSLRNRLARLETRKPGSLAKIAAAKQHTLGAAPPGSKTVWLAKVVDAQPGDAFSGYCVAQQWRVTAYLPAATAQAIADDWTARYAALMFDPRGLWHYEASALEEGTTPTDATTGTCSPEQLASVSAAGASMLWAVQLLTQEVYGLDVDCIQSTFPVAVGTVADMAKQAHDLTVKHIENGWRYIATPIGAPPPRLAGPYGQVPRCAGPTTLGEPATLGDPPLPIQWTEIAPDSSENYTFTPGNSYAVLASASLNFTADQIKSYVADKGMRVTYTWEQGQASRGFYPIDDWLEKLPPDTTSNHRWLYGEAGMGGQTPWVVGVDAPWPLTVYTIGHVWQTSPRDVNCPACPLPAAITCPPQSSALVPVAIGGALGVGGTLLYRFLRARYF